MKNWAGNLTYRARRVHEPGSVEEVQALVAESRSIRAIGTRHSFSDIADTDGDLVSLAHLPRILDIDSSARTVTIDGWMRYGDLGPRLNDAGFALDNLPALPHVSIAGACATGTHGSGDRSRVLADAVVGMELVVGDGSIVRLVAGGDPSGIPLEAAAVALGALGVITALTLRIEPAYSVRQDVFVDLPVVAFGEAFEIATTQANSASFFTTWQSGVIDQVWLKRRVSGGEPARALADVAGARPATRALHPIPGFSADACTPQLGEAGPWNERLPHFRLSHTPSSGDELQSEYFVAREHAVDAFRELHAMGSQIAPLIQVSEVRTVAADELWLSPAFGRPSVAFHFTWLANGDAVRALLPRIENVLAPFAPRPHWAKLSTISDAAIAASWPRLGDFAALSRRADPTGKLLNDRVRTVLGRE